LIDFDPNLPIYVQIMNGIKQDLVSGALKPGDRLTSVREQAESLSVNPNTVQRAYQELEREGVSETRRGMGSYIADRDGLIAGLRDEIANGLTGRFIDGMRAIGYSDAGIQSHLATSLAARGGQLSMQKESK